MKRPIAICNQNVETILSLVCFEKRLIVNSRIRIDENGSVTFNCNTENATADNIMFKIGVYSTAEVMKARLTWYGHKHVFKLYPLVGPILIDPLQPTEQEERGKNDVNVRVNIVAVSKHEAATAGTHSVDGNVRMNTVIEGEASGINNILQNRTLKMRFNLRNLDQAILDMSQQFSGLFSPLVRFSGDKL